jgi:hypothetical protein
MPGVAVLCLSYALYSLGNLATHGQLYMIDTQSARERVVSEVPSVDAALLDTVHNYLLRHNAYVKGFVTMKEKQEEEDRLARRANRQPRELKLLFSMDEKVCQQAVENEFQSNRNLGTL